MTFEVFFTIPGYLETTGIVLHTLRSIKKMKNSPLAAILQPELLELLGSSALTALDLTVSTDNVEAWRLPRSGFTVYF